MNPSTYAAWQLRKSVAQAKRRQTERQQADRRYARGDYDDIGQANVASTYHAQRLAARGLLDC
jgi:hypothetical protein